MLNERCCYCFFVLPLCRNEDFVYCCSAECVTLAAGVSKLYVIHLIWFRAVYSLAFSTWRHKIWPYLACTYLTAHQARSLSLSLWCVCVCLYFVYVPTSRYSDSLRAGRSGVRIPVGARFSAPVQTDPGAHPASCTMGTGSFPGVKRPGRGADPPPPSSVPRS